MTPTTICKVINLLRQETDDVLDRMASACDVAMGAAMYHNRREEANRHNLTALLCRKELMRRKAIVGGYDPGKGDDKSLPINVPSRGSH